MNTLERPADKKYPSRLPRWSAGPSGLHFRRPDTDCGTGVLERDLDLARHDDGLRDQRSCLVAVLLNVVFSELQGRKTLRPSVIRAAPEQRGSLPETGAHW